ncbi:MAG: NADH-quinone oxidoreductase subunit J, partial [Planctomycetaceae bacterium]|nr:NADH-quinone oxidoreductase subunit J [Planctomycetaceae bacterium]
METALFTVFALGACGGALAVVLSQNIVRMAFYLVISLGSTGGLFFLLGADFVGATQLLIYVGGTVVLLIFGVMLTASGPFLVIKTSPGDLVQAGVVGGLFLGLIVFTVLQVDWQANSLKLEGRYGASLVDQPGFNQQGEGHT